MEFVFKSEIKMDSKKILVGYIDDLKHSGIDKYLLNVLKIAQEQNIQLDFLSSIYDTEAVEYLNSVGCNVFKISSLKNPIKHYNDVKNVIKNGNYDKVYFNISEPLNCMGVKAAFDSNVYNIVHSHSSGMNIANPIKRCIRRIINFLMRPYLRKYSNKFLACSMTAAQWLFGNKAVKNNITVIYNAVDSNKFSENTELRDEIRNELNISKDKLVIGHIGHYCYQKNNLFLPQILAEVVKTNKNVHMLLIGNGEDLEKTKERFKDLHLSEYVTFLGIRNDVDRLLKAMDVFVLPSRFEGLPIVAVEAQLSGLPCILSKKIDKLSKIHSNCHFLDIDDASKWAKYINRISKNPISYNSDALDKFTLNNNKSQIINNIFANDEL